MPGYKIVVTDRDYVPQGELANFGDLSLSRALSKLSTASFSVKLGNDQAERLAACDGHVKIFRGSQMVFGGPIITAEETVERHNDTVKVNCADVGWNLGKRLCGRAAGGRIVTTLTDRAIIARDLIDSANTTAETGVSTSVYVPSSGSQITWRSAPFRVTLEGIVELASALDGFDWRIVPTDNWSNGARTSLKLGAFEAKPVIGTLKSNAVFEYGAGTRSNVLSYTKTRSRDTQATRMFHHINDGSDYVTSDNIDAIAVWDVMEATADAALTDVGMRQNLVDEHAKVRGFPRDLVRMTPHIDPGVTGRLPQPFVEYDVGDQVPFKAMYADTIRFAGILRVYGIQINVENETGFERVTLTLEDEA